MYLYISTKSIVLIRQIILINSPFPLSVVIIERIIWIFRTHFIDKNHKGQFVVLSYIKTRLISSFRCFFFSGIHNFEFFTTNCFHHCYFDAAYYIDFVEGSYARGFSFHLLRLKEQIIYKDLSDQIFQCLILHRIKRKTTALL